MLSDHLALVLKQMAKCIFHLDVKTFSIPDKRRHKKERNENKEKKKRETEKKNVTLSFILL